MHRVRIIGLALLALAVPQLAFGDQEPSTAPATLSVSASLDGCGLAEAAIVCQIDASWNALDGADYYTVSVTRPDGSVVDAGQGAGTSRSVFVPYVGAGTYSVQVAAWGTPPGEDEPEVLAREKAMSAGGDGAPTRVEARSSGDEPAREDGATELPENDDADSGEPVTEPPAGEDPACDDPADDGEESDAQLSEGETSTPADAATAPDDALGEPAEDSPPDCP